MYSEDRLNKWLEEQKTKISSRDHSLLQKAAGILTKENLCRGEQFPWFPYGCIRPFGNRKVADSGIWNWDSAFHAIGVLHWDPALAKEQILGFIQYQLDDGMFVDAKRANGETCDFSCKPPLLAWAAGEICKKDPDPSFAERVYPKFVKNEAFWRNHRFYKGMFHYGADMTRTPFEQLDLYVRYESGWDNSVRWDLPCANYWPIDLNCFGVMMYRGLTAIAELLGKTTDAEVWRTRERLLSENINRLLWNDEQKTYTDTDRFSGTPSVIMTPASFMPLYIGIATKERAKHMARFASDPKKLYPGMPTVAYDDPAYSQDYWRGNTWLNVAYFAAKGLKDYGYDQTAEDIRQTILSWVEKDGECIHENYNSTTGEGLYNPKFSWSSVYVIEFILNF